MINTSHWNNVEFRQPLPRDEFERSLNHEGLPPGRITLSPPGASDGLPPPFSQLRFELMRIALGRDSLRPEKPPVHDGSNKSKSPLSQLAPAGPPVLL